METAGPKGVYDASKIASQHFQQAIDKFFYVLTHSNSMSDVDNAWKELWDACKEDTDVSIDAAKETIKDRMLAAGWTEKNVDDFLGNRWKDVKDAADKVRETAPKVVTKTKHLWAKMMAGVALTCLSVFAYISGSDWGQNGVDSANRLNEQYRRDLEMARYQREMNDFNALTSALRAPALPDIPTGADPTEAVRAALPVQIAELPASVAAVAIQPIQVTAKAPNGETKTFTSTVGQMYNDVPEMRRDIRREAEDQQAEAKPYRYAFQEPGSCSQRHCLSASGGISGSWDGRKNGTDLHAESH